MQAKLRLNVLALGLVLSVAVLVAALPRKAYAVGSAVFTTESASSVTTGANLQVSLYVTPTLGAGDAGLWSASVVLSLGNLTYSLYTPNSSAGAFGYNVVQSSSSNSVEITAAHTSGTGSTGKTLIGVVTVQAGSAASGQLNLGSTLAGDYDSNTMSTSDQDRSVTITCPAGQTGTPPSCSSASGGGGSTGGGSTGGGSTSGGSTGGGTPSGGTANPVDNPNPNSTANVGTDENGQPVTVSEDEYSQLVNGIAQDNATETVASTSKSSTLKRTLTVAGLAMLVVVALLGGKLLLSRARMAKELNRHVSGASFGHTAAPDPHQASDDKDSHHTPGGPTIITPQK